MFYEKSCATIILSHRLPIWNSVWFIGNRILNIIRKFLFKKFVEQWASSLWTFKENCHSFFWSLWSIIFIHQSVLLRNVEIEHHVMLECVSKFMFCYLGDKLTIQIMKYTGRVSNWFCFVLHYCFLNEHFLELMYTKCWSGYIGD